MALTDQIKDEIQTKIDQTDKLSPEEENLRNKDAGQKFEDPSVDGVIDLSATRKKRFNVDLGSGSYRVLELDTSDMTIINRLEKLYPKLQKLSQEASIKQLDLKDNDNERVITKLSQALTKIDAQMREIVDDIFNSNVSEVCAPSGSMFDPFNGEFRFEHIIDKISALYKNNVNDEFRKMSAKMKKRTSKYTKGK